MSDLPDGVPRRRDFAASRILDLGQHRRGDEARRLRDLLARFVIPNLGHTRRVPTDEELARAFHCSRNTARIALRMLADERAIARSVGVGTYSSREPYFWHPDIMVDTAVGLSDTPPSGSFARQVGWRVVEQIPEAMLLSFPNAVSLAIFEKVSFYGGTPGSLRTYYLPLREGDTVTETDGLGDMYDLLEHRFGHAPLHGERTISALGADESAAELLGIRVGDPLLYIETVVKNSRDEAVMHYIGRQRTDVVQFSLAPERLSSR